jgi:5-methylthioadenosine/S-adenosylhomocysteine deaminase
LSDRLDALSEFTGERARLGVSPHAPYSVSAPLYRRVAALASERGLPVAVHLAESLEESRLVVHGDGRFADLWAGRGIASPVSARTPVEFLDQQGVLGPETLAIHLVQVDASDIATLAMRGTAVAHCPLSNRNHRHGEAPVAAMLAAGLRVGVGTDSVVSVGRLDLLAETRSARILAALDAETALALCTTGAAAAIGLAGEVGALAPGHWGDVAAIRLRDRAPTDLFEAILASGPGDLVATWVGGREVYRAFPRPLSLQGDSLPTGA